MNLGHLRRLHFMGIGGAGMCALAELALAHGLPVSGCDLHASERTAGLVERGATVEIGHAAGHIDGVDALIVSSAVDPGHAEVVAARRADVPVVKRSVLLAEAMRCRQGIAVAGSHGKTTTTALTGVVLNGCGLDPTVVVGGRVPALGGHGRRGSSRLFVCEADEYDRSFLTLHPAWLVITNVEAEHLDTYGTVDELEAAFATLAARIPFYGAVIACADDPGARRIVERCVGRVVTYGLSNGARVRAVSLAATTSGNRFSLVLDGEPAGEVELPLSGEHNVRNTLAAIAVGLEMELSVAQMAPAISGFSGVERRFFLAGERDGVTVVDDYAHHPTELRALIAAAREVSRQPARRGLPAPPVQSDRAPRRRAGQGAGPRRRGSGPPHFRGA